MRYPASIGSMRNLFKEDTFSYDNITAKDMFRSSSLGTILVYFEEITPYLSGETEEVHGNSQDCRGPGLDMNSGFWYTEEKCCLLDRKVRCCIYLMYL
jgi:hypothetical protein